MKTALIILTVFLVTFVMKFRKEKKKQAELNQYEVTLTDKENALLEKLKIDEAVGLVVKSMTNEPLVELFIEYQMDDRTPELKGFKSQFDEQKRLEAVQQLRKKLDNDQYQVFSCGGFAGEENYYLAVIKTTDRYDILRVLETNGINHDIETPQIIEFLKKWETTASFYFLDVDHDRFTIHFENLDFDLEGFCQEAVEFCPDFLSAFEDASDLKSYIERQKKVDFWWD